MKNKILHIIYNLGVGGTEKMLLNTLPLLSDFQHLVCVINSVNPSVSGEFKAKGIMVVRLKGAKIFHFRKIIKEEKPDLMMTYLIYADLFGRLFGRLFGVKKIVTSIRSTYGESKYKFWLALEKLTSSMVDKYIAVSETAKTVYQKELGIPPEKIEVIYNAVDIPKFNIEIDRNRKRKELGIPEENFVLGAIGKWRPEKGQIYLIWALPEILKKFPQTTLVLVGGGENRKKLSELAKSTGVEKNVLLLDERGDIPEILKTFDIFLNPSLYEGLSNSILEAMAAQVPIVASDIPSNTEIIENKKSGLLVPVMDGREIAEAVIEILSNPDLGKNLSAAAFQNVQNFSIEKTVEKLNQFLQFRPSENSNFDDFLENFVHK
jgi:glycosyltransferase involved in cell wall biosynthesis